MWNLHRKLHTSKRNGFCSESGWNLSRIKSIISSIPPIRCNNLSRTPSMLINEPTSDECPIGSEDV